MKEAIENDYRKMIYLAWGGTAVVFVGCALFIGGFTFWDWGLVPSAIIGLLVWGIGLVMLTVVEHLKKQHDVVTYRELVAFSKGEPIDRNNAKSLRARRHPVLRRAPHPRSRRGRRRSRLLRLPALRVESQRAKRTSCVDQKQVDRVHDIEYSATVMDLEFFIDILPNRGNSCPKPAFGHPTCGSSRCFGRFSRLRRGFRGPDCPLR